MIPSHPVPCASYPPLPSGPSQAVDVVVLPPSTGLVARDLLAALLAGLYAWQHTALDLTLVFDCYVNGSWRPYAAVGHLWGLSIGLIPRDDGGTVWAVDIACPHGDLSRRDVRLVHLRAVLADIMLALCACTPGAHRSDESAENGTRPAGGFLPAWYAQAQAALPGAGLPVAGSTRVCDSCGRTSAPTQRAVCIGMHEPVQAAALPCGVTPRRALRGPASSPYSRRAWSIVTRNGAVRPRRWRR